MNTCSFYGLYLLFSKRKIYDILERKKWGDGKNDEQIKVESGKIKVKLFPYFDTNTVAMIMHNLFYENYLQKLITLLDKNTI